MKQQIFCIVPNELCVIILTQTLQLQIPNPHFLKSYLATLTRATCAVLLREVEIVIRVLLRRRTANDALGYKLNL